MFNHLIFPIFFLFFSILKLLDLNEGLFCKERGKTNSLLIRTPAMLPFHLYTSSK